MKKQLVVLLCGLQFHTDLLFGYDVEINVFAPDAQQVALKDIPKLASGPMAHRLGDVCAAIPGVLHFIGSEGATPQSNPYVDRFKKLPNRHTVSIVCRNVKVSDVITTEIPWSATDMSSPMVKFDVDRISNRGVSGKITLTFRNSVAPAVYTFEGLIPMITDVFAVYGGKVRKGGSMPSLNEYFFITLTIK